MSLRVFFTGTFIHAHASLPRSVKRSSYKAGPTTSVIDEDSDTIKDFAFSFEHRIHTVMCVVVVNCSLDCQQRREVFKTTSAFEPNPSSLLFYYLLSVAFVFILFVFF